MNNTLPKPKSGFWWSLFRVLQLLVIVYALVVLAVLIFQRRLIYFPTRLTTEAAIHEAADHGFTPWKNSAGQLIGWKMLVSGASTGTSTGSVLIVHGNASCALDRDYIARPVHDAADVDVYVLEYPGYGARAGSPGKSSFVAAAEEAFQLLSTNSPRYIVSESIGTGVACELAKNHPSEIAGLALLAPYHDLASVAQKQMPFLPAYFLLLDRFNPAACLKSYHGPVNFVVGGADEIIGAASGEKLFEGYQGPKELKLIHGAHHNEVPAQSTEWWREIFSFWHEHANRS